jgi:protein arginine N-methyltransferase 5
LSLPAVLFPQLPACGVNTCRLINQCVQQRPYFQVWVTVPLVEWGLASSAAVGDAAAAAAAAAAVALPEDSPWARWNRLRVSCEHSQALFVALELGVDLPDRDTDIARWEAEPVKVLLLPVACFLTNKKGFPVLSKRHQGVVARFAKFNVQVLVTGKPRHAQGRKVYQQYLRHAWQVRLARTLL